MAICQKREIDIPIYVYNLLDPDGNPSGEQFETLQKMADDSYTEHPETGQPCERAICLPNIKHGGNTWDWCESTRRYINKMKPKYISDEKTGVRKRYPKGGV